MKPEDQEALKKAKWEYLFDGDQDSFEDGFKAALSHRDAQVSAINEQMLEALKHLYHNAKKSGAEMGLALDVAQDAITAAEAHKEPKC